MKSRQFPTFKEAVAYMESKGEVQYFGREGHRFEYCIYTLTIGMKIYHCNVYDTGLLRVVHERYK